MTEPAAGPVHVRVARHDDVSAVLGVWAAARSAVAATPDDVPTVERLLDHAPDAVLVAECGGQLVGVLVATWDGWRGSMYRLAVLAPYRRRGIARRLVEAGHEQLRRQGVGRVTALVGRDDEQAWAFWRSAGYRHDEQVARFVAGLDLLPQDAGRPSSR